MPDVAGVAGAGHAREASGHGTAIARSQKLPLLQREVRELIDADEKKLRALILVDVVFVAAVAEARGRSVTPRDDVLRFVVLAIEFPRYVATKISEERRFQFRIGAAQEQRIRARHRPRLPDRL